MSDLKIIRMGYSHRSRSIKSMPPITVVTQLSIDRLERLSLLCSCWDGPVVAAILDENRSSIADTYRLNNKSKDLISELENRIHTQAVSSNSACMLQTILLKRRIRNHVTKGDIYTNKEPDQQLMDNLYPINELRNVALNAARSEFVLLLDVDCVLSKDALKILSGWSLHADNSPAISDRLSVLRNLCIEAPGAIVIPCFEANFKGEKHFLRQ